MLLGPISPRVLEVRHKPEEGRPTARRDIFAATTSDSVLDMDTDACFLENAVNGKYVLGPISTRKQAVVLRLSYSPAWSASAKHHRRHLHNLIAYESL